MSEKSGIHYILKNPIIYSVVQWIFSHKKTTYEWDQLFLNIENKTILDIGCGLGDQSKKFKNCQYIGVDISKVYIDHAKKNFSNYGEFYLLSADNIQNLPNKSFDFVILKGVIHHLNDKQMMNLILFFQERLSTNGKIISLDPVFTEKQNKLSKYFVSKDRGENIRLSHDYEAFFNKNFQVKRSEVIKQFFPPYQRLLMEIYK